MFRTVVRHQLQTDQMTDGPRSEMFCFYSSLNYVQITLNQPSSYFINNAVTAQYEPLFRPYDDVIAKPLSGIQQINHKL